jgi:hypothetical protein
MFSEPRNRNCGGVFMKPEKSSNFDPNKIQALAEKMIADGTMPPPDQFLAAIERIRAEYAERILKAREQDEMENSGVHPGLKTASEKPESVKTKSKKKPVNRA